MNVKRDMLGWEWSAHIDENISFGQLMPQFRKNDFYPELSINMMALVRGSLTSRQIRTSYLWTMIGRKGPSESGLSTLFHNTTAVVIITIGFMTFGVWPSERVEKWGWGGGGGAVKYIYTFFSQTRELNSEVRNPILIFNAGYSPQREIFIMVLIKGAYPKMSLYSNNVQGVAHDLGLHP